MGDTIITKKAKVAPLYVYRRVLNAADVIAWAKANGFEKCVPPEEMHVTVAHSSDALDWTAAGDHFDNLIAEGGVRSVAPLGDKGAVVLKFQLGELNDRWQEFRDAGASWDFPGYQPHVTLTYNGGGIDLSGIAPFAGPIQFGPEVFEAMTDNWSDGLIEKSQKARIAKIDEEHGIVYGWAIVCEKDGEPYYDLNIDKNDDGTWERVPEHIPPLSMVKAALNFAENAERPGNEMHKGPDSGSYVFMMPMTAEMAKGFGIETSQTGLMVGYKPTPDVLQKFRDGTYTGFSIEGSRISCEESE